MHQLLTEHHLGRGLRPINSISAKRVYTYEGGEETHPRAQRVEHLRFFTPPKKENIRRQQKKHWKLLKFIDLHPSTKRLDQLLVGLEEAAFRTAL